MNAAGLVPGTYSAAVQATAPGYAPTTTTLTLTVTAPLATVARRAAGAVSVYPNPAASHATVAFYSLTAQVAHLEVHSSHGQLVWQGHCRATAGDNRFELTTRPFAAGLYLLRVQLQEGISTARLLLAP